MNDIALGLRIKLKKVNQHNFYNIKLEEGYAFPSIIGLGHYDIVEVERVGSLSDFRPAKSQTEASGNVPGLFYTEYILKLIAMRNIYGQDANNQIEEEYRYWQAQDKSEVKDYVKTSRCEFSEMPFIAVITVDINDKDICDLKKYESQDCEIYNKGQTKKIHSYKKLINDICNSAANKKVSIAPYYCLGYTDFVIMARSNNLSAIGAFIDKLREHDAVSSTYTILCIKRNVSRDVMSDDMLSVRFEWNYIDNSAIGKEVPFIQVITKIKDVQQGIMYGAIDNYAVCDYSEKDLYKLFNENNPYLIYGDQQVKTTSSWYDVKRIKNFNTVISFKI